MISTNGDSIMTPNTLTIRPANMEDSGNLFRWRNDPETCKNSLNTNQVELDGHLKWLAASLINPDRTLFIVELDGAPVGTARLDYSGELGERICEMSWTVAPEWRGQSIGKRMAIKTREAIECDRVVAKIRPSNVASQKLAEAIGLKLFERDAGSGFDTWTN